VIPTLPPEPRNRLAHLILDSLHDRAARARLAALAADAAERGDWFTVDADRAGCARLRARAERASAALSGRPLLPRDMPLDAALEAASVLFGVELYFEVHELLEPYWRDAEGDLRQVLQGLIQIAVGYQHLANGNRAGARSVLADGLERVRGVRVHGVDAAPFVAGVPESLRRLTTAPPDVR
jgi:Domain of unknown function (DUF309)